MEPTALRRSCPGIVSSCLWLEGMLRAVDGRVLIPYRDWVDTTGTQTEIFTNEFMGPPGTGIGVGEVNNLTDLKLPAASFPANQTADLVSPKLRMLPAEIDDALLHCLSPEAGKLRAVTIP